MEIRIEDRLAPVLPAGETGDGLPWRSPLARDLAWAVGSPPLVRYDDGTTWPASEWFSKQLQGFTAALDRLDRELLASSAALPIPEGGRLGAYFESLIGLWLERDPRFQVLASNLPVRRPLPRGGRETLGELDLVVDNREVGRVEHWEVAVKFYLGRLPGTLQEGLPEWVGPGLKDALDTKVQRLMDHQLKMPDRKSTRALLTGRGLDIAASRVILKGRLFYPLPGPLPPPPIAAPDHLRGWWMYTRDFPNRFAGNGWRWRRLSRREWLAPVIDDEEAQQSLPGSEDFAATEDIRSARWPRLVVGLCDGREMTRGFLVPRGWGVAGKF